MVFVILLSGFDAAVDETSPSAPLAQPPPLSRGGFGVPVSFRLNKQSTMSQEQECSAVQGSGSLTRCVVQKLLPSVARPALLRHVGPRASSRKWPGLPRPLPLGEVARRRRDGEGKPVTAKPPHSDEQTLLSERYYRCAFASPPASLPSQALRASSPRGGAVCEAD